MVSEFATMVQRNSLESYPFEFVRLACDRCCGAKQYRKDKLIALHGPEVRLHQLGTALIDRCNAAQRRTRCGVYFPDLMTE